MNLNRLLNPVGKRSWLQAVPGQEQTVAHLTNGHRLPPSPTMARAKSAFLSVAFRLNLSLWLLCTVS